MPSAGEPSEDAIPSVASLERRVADLLAYQSATNDILHAIGRSRGELQPVLDAIVTNAARLCDSIDAQIFRIDGDVLRPAAAYGSLPKISAGETRPLNRGSLNGRAVLDRRTIHIHDLAAVDENEWPEAKAFQKRFGHRTILATPLIRDGIPLGAITVRRMEVRPFSDDQIALLETFADQAAIAIENVRLFNETNEGLERQTAISDILRAISSSPTTLEPVLEAVVNATARFCGAPDVVMLRVDGDVLRGAAGVGQFADIINRRAGSIAAIEIPVSRGSVSGRAVFERRTVHIHDLAAESDDEFPIGRDLQRRFGHRTCLATPLLRQGVPLGVICLFRMEAKPFTEKHIELLRTFADQAAIAIENVRLFTRLTQSVSELEALGEIGQAVSSTLDLETVLSTIVSRATQLAGMDGGSIWEYDEAREEFGLRATHQLPLELVDALRGMPIRRGEGALGRLAGTREPVEIVDIVDEPGYPAHLRELLVRSGYRALLAVPLLRENRLLGALIVNRSERGAFAPEVIGLLRTFATQSALAIQNARLYRELEAKSRALEAAGRHKSEFLANMSHELRTPLNAIIGFSEVLQERMFGEVNDKQAEYLGDILESGKHLLSLINDILDLSKIEAGRMELQPGDFDLPAAIDNALLLVRERAQRRGIALERAVDPQLGVLRADERKVKQVLLNLLSNALKFTPEGGRVRVDAAIANGMVEISVSDTGVGIAPEDLTTVFEEFRQVGTAAKKVEGTGLGLAISRRFVELHGGTIGVTSVVGEGSTFTFTLPLRDPCDRERASTPSAMGAR